MRKLLIEISALLIVFSGFVALLEYHYNNYKTPVDFIIDKFDRKKDISSTIIIGNSHAEMLGPVKLLPDSFSTVNISMGGQDLYHILLLLEKCIPEAENLKLVVLGLDYELAGYNLAKEKQEWKDRFYYPWNRNIYDRSFGNIIMAKSNFMRSNRDLSFIFKPQKTDASELLIPPVSDGNDDYYCKKRAQEHSVYKFNRDLAEENMSYLKRISELCRKNKITLLLINTPKTDCYTHYFNKEVAGFSSGLYKKFSQENKVLFLDLFSDSCYTESDFIDFDHLNEQGVGKIASGIKEVLYNNDPQ
ncbi:MAG: hypothetical protein ABIJ16_00620 [Bacteroidota bacterium]